MGRAVVLPGQKFGKLTILGKEGTDQGRAVWHVRCDCGAEDLMTRPEKRSSCGCAQRKDLTGRTFGKLTVVRYAGSSTDRRSTWFCHCSCGLTKTVRANDLTSGKTTSCGCNQLRHGSCDTAEYKVYTNTVQNQGSSFEGFLDFLETEGARPSDSHRITRKNPHQPHGPNNTYWRNADDYAELTQRDLTGEFFLDMRAFAGSRTSAAA